MVYFVFDMDATLANLYTVHYFLCDLRREVMIGNVDLPSDELKEYLDKAYTIFVNKIAIKEGQADRLGVLRPGILFVMRLLNEYKQLGLIDGVIIYSNNGALGTLHFIRDLIHTYIGNSDLICDCIHWGHKARDSERNLAPGSAKKTWSVLKNILTNPEGPCKAPATLEPKDVYFVDDQFHPDLKRFLPIYHYIQVTPYEFKTPFESVAEIYKESLEESGLFEDSDQLDAFFTHVHEGCLKKKVDTIDAVLTRYKSATHASPAGTATPQPDRYIQILVTMIQSLKPKRGGTRRSMAHKKRGQSRRRIHGRRHTRKVIR